MNTYKIIFWTILSLLYVGLFWIFPLFFDKTLIDIMVLHVLIISITTLGCVLGWLSEKAGY